MNDNKKVVLDDTELKDVHAGMMTFAGGNNVLRYKHADGTVTRHQIIGDYNKAYKRSCALHVDTDDEDYILSVLQQEGYIGDQL